MCKGSQTLALLSGRAFLLLAKIGCTTCSLTTHRLDFSITVLWQQLQSHLFVLLKTTLSMPYTIQLCCIQLLYAAKLHRVWHEGLFTFDAHSIHIRFRVV